MITFFSIPRAFVGEFDALQLMAVKSWESAVPGCQVVLMGSDEGVREVCFENGWQHIPALPRNSYGTPLVSGAFHIAESVTRHDLLCEISADIVMSGELNLWLEEIYEVEKPFVIGQRWDIQPGAAPETAILHPPSGIDYFIYRRGTLGDIPSFAVGRTVYDNWLVWAAVEKWGLTVIDATKAITAIHVNHGYPLWKNGKADMLASDEKKENNRLAYATGMTRPYGVNDAPWILKQGRIEKRSEHAHAT